jgi:creatinine amidohydrolase
MSWPEVADALKSVQLAIVPTGSCEQHGPNMSMKTDTAICNAIAERLTARLHPRALLTPVVSLGVSPHHLTFPGTISLRPETFEAVLWDTVMSLKRHGLRYFLFVNGHGGNMDALNVMALKMRTELDVQVAVMFYLRLASDVVQQGAQTTLYGHACEVEVSVAQYLGLDIVKDNLARGDVLPYAHAHTDIKKGPRIDYPFTFDDFTANGALGDARLATPEYGQAIVETALERTMEFLATFLPSQ